MYAVIFRAEINRLDQQYLDTAQKLRELALNQYGCTEFTSCTEGDYEIAISYWPNLEHIKAWKNNSQHLQAQAIGKSRWYKSFQVQVVQLLGSQPSTD